MFRPIMMVAIVAAVIQAAECGGDSESSQLEDLTRQVEDLSRRTEVLERDLAEPLNTGDDWQSVRDAATPELCRAVEL